MIDSLTTAWSRPYKIVRVMQALGMEVPQRLRRERLAALLDALKRNGVEANLQDGTAIDPNDSPGIEAKIRLRLAASAQPAGHEFGYQILEKIPTGGMSTCFKVSAPDGQLRFLKKVPLRGFDADALRREVQVYAKLDLADAQHVLRVVDFQTTSDHLALITEYADGGTLDEGLERLGDVPASEAKKICAAVAAGLFELHSHGIVHRDLKPQNVLLAGGEWKLADFGISKNLSRIVTSGRTFQRTGTPGYTPPEQWLGSEAHPSADVYAFGKLITFVLTRETDIDRLTADFPVWARLVRACVQYDPDARPTLEALQQDLAAL